MESEKQKIKEIVLKFFESLKCKISFDGESLIVDNVPSNFEKFTGKKGPFFFSFEGQKKGFEEINSSSYIIKAIKEYLENQGQTAIISIKPNKELNEVALQKFILRNAKILKIEKRIIEKNFTRFTFLTNFMYLNKKEQVTNSICLKDGEEIEVNLGDFKSEEAKKLEFDSLHLKEIYEKAKLIILKKTAKVKEEIEKELKKNLEKEIHRIKEHYENQRRELNQGIEKLEERKIKFGEKKEEIQRLENEILKIKEKSSYNESQDEEQKIIKEEIQKHGLKIKNSLINTTIVFYPKYIFSIYLQNKTSSRIIQRDYDSVLEKITNIRCDSCNEEISEIVLCSSGHITCLRCGETCENCGEIKCLKCEKIICNECSKNLCKNCSKKCRKCLQNKCINHILEINGEFICRKCFLECDICKKKFTPEKLHQFKGKNFCPDCLRKRI